MASIQERRAYRIVHLAELQRPRLLAIAAQLKVRGRSRMNRKQLQTAILDARFGPGAPTEDDD